MTNVQHAWLLLTDDSSAVISNRVDVSFLAVPRTVLFNPYSIQLPVSLRERITELHAEVDTVIRYDLAVSTVCTSESLAFCRSTIMGPIQTRKTRVGT